MIKQSTIQQLKLEPSEYEQLGSSNINLGTVMRWPELCTGGRLVFMADCDEFGEMLDNKGMYTIVARYSNVIVTCYCSRAFVGEPEAKEWIDKMLDSKPYSNVHKRIQ